MKTIKVTGLLSESLYRDIIPLKEWPPVKVDNRFIPFVPKATIQFGDRLVIADGDCMSPQEYRRRRNEKMFRRISVSADIQ